VSSASVLIYVFVSVGALLGLAALAVGYKKYSQRGGGGLLESKNSSPVNEADLETSMESSIELNSNKNNPLSLEKVRSASNVSGTNM